MKTLITGGTGFLGTYLTRHLVDRDGPGSVVVLDRFPDVERLGELAQRITVTCADVLDLDALERVMAEHGVDRVAHLASAPGPPAPDRIPQYVQLQCVGTANVFEAARRCGIKRVATASSVAVFGYGEGAPVTDDAPPAPANLYGASKVWAEDLARTYNAQHGMEIISLRVCASLGFGRLTRRSLDSGLTPPGHERHWSTLPELAAIGEAVAMPPSEQKFDVLFTPDAAQAWALALTAERPSHREYNLSTEQRTFGDMTACLRELLPDAEITVAGERVRAPRRMRNARLVEDLGFAPRLTLERGLRWYVNEARRARGMAEIDVG